MVKEKKFIPIDLAVLRLDTLKPFDIFIKTGRDGEPYVLYSRKGQCFTDKIKQNLLLNKVATIYVLEDVRDIYQEYVEENLQYIIKDKAIPPTKKSKIVYESSTYVMEKLFENPRADMISRTQRTVNNIVSLILSDRKTTRQLVRITDHDYYTHTHSVNVGVFSVAFAKELLPGLSEEEFFELGLGFFMHDIGKSLIPIEVIHKRGPLNEEEWKIIKTHPEKGYQILEKAGFMTDVSAKIVLQHHERVNGSGYPRGLRGDEIDIYGKICSVADIFDAMTTERCYQKASSAYDALDLIKHKMFKEFDYDFFSKFVLLFAPDDTKPYSNLLEVSPK